MTLLRACAVEDRVWTDARVEVGDRAGSAGGPVRALTALAPLGLALVLLAGVSHTQSVAAWGANLHGACTVPSAAAYVQIAAGEEHTVARRSDGSVVAWGNNGLGQCNVPALPAGLTRA